jgi:two-component system sensor histidine kinase/response regulator
MFRSVLSKIYMLGVRTANIGVSDDMSFHEKKKTQVINVSVVAGISPKVYFGILNFLQGKIVLGVINVTLLLGGIAILVIHSYRRFLMARLIMIFAASILFTVSAVLYRNGGEYFLMANLIIIIIFFNERKYMIGISIMNCLLFVGIKIFLQYGVVYDSIPFGRFIFNISWTLIIMVLALWFFKTEQVVYQQQIEEKNGELETINKTKEKLFSIIAHDLRSPIAQLKGSLDLVNREYISPEQFHEMTAKLSAQVDQLHNTMDNLLRWSLSQLQGITAKPERTDLEPVLQNGLTLFTEKLEQKNIALVLQGVKQTVMVDPDHLQVVLRNLISNAVKYSYPGSTISIYSHVIGSDVTISITDTGTGMNDSVKRSVFYSENLVSKLGTANEKGTGLGLKLCREFIEKNNGSIRVESFENKGSTFFVSLPNAV